MDVQEQKNDLILWLTKLEDPGVIEVLSSIRISEIDKKEIKTTSEERVVIDKGLRSLKESGTKPHHEVAKQTKNKYPHLFE